MIETEKRMHCSRIKDIITQFLLLKIGLQLTKDNETKKFLILSSPNQSCASVKAFKNVGAQTKLVIVQLSKTA